MIAIGEYNTLKASKFTQYGIFLTDDSGQEVLLPNQYVPENVKEGDMLRVFVYRDSHNRPTATTLKPAFILNEFAWLPVKQISQYGAFLDWGLEKDLMVPFREQAQRMVLGKSYMVYLYRDDQSDRLVATSKLNRYFSNDVSGLTPGQEVQVLIWKKTDLGIKVIVDQTYQGMIHENELFQRVQPGDQVTGFIQNIRPDGKLDIRLDRTGVQSIEPNAEKVLALMKANRGYLDLTDKSDPELIKERLGMSKKAFKKAIGNLYRQRILRIEDTGLFLILRADQL